LIDDSELQLRIPKARPSQDLSGVDSTKVEKLVKLVAKKLKFGRNITAEE
jgi:hypothetical protein